MQNTTHDTLTLPETPHSSLTLPHPFRHSPNYPLNLPVITVNDAKFATFAADPAALFSLHGLDVAFGAGPRADGRWRKTEPELKQVRSNKDASEVRD